MRKSASYSSTIPDKARLKRSVSFLGVFRLPSWRDLSNYFSNGQQVKREKSFTDIEKYPKGRRKSPKVVEVAQENGDLKVDVVSEEVFFEKPLFGRSKSELSQHMLQRKREEIRDGLSTEDKCLMDAPKNPPILASPTKLRKSNKVGVMFADSCEGGIENSPSKKLMRANTELHTSILNPPSPIKNPSPPSTPVLFSMAKRRKEEIRRPRKNSITRSTSFRSVLEGKVVKDEDTAMEEEDTTDEDEVAVDALINIPRSKSTANIATRTPRKKDHASMLHRIDKENIDFVKVLPELLWLRVAVLLAPSDLLKLRSLSKKFTKYVNTNLVWASYSWRDFGNITVSSKSWREHYAQAFVQSKQPLTLSIKTTKHTLKLGEKMEITASIYNRSHKPVVIELGGSENNSETNETKETNIFESGVLLRAGKATSVGFCRVSSVGVIDTRKETKMLTIAPKETKTFSCRVIAASFNDSVGLLVENGSKNFLPLTKGDTTIWYDYKSTCMKGKDDIIYWNGRVCSNSVPITVAV